MRSTAAKATCCWTPPRAAARRRSWWSASCAPCSTTASRWRRSSRSHSPRRPPRSFATGSGRGCGSSARSTRPVPPRARSSRRSTVSARVCCARTRSRPGSIRRSWCSIEPEAERLADAAFDDALEDPVAERARWRRADRGVHAGRAARGDPVRAYDELRSRGADLAGAAAARGRARSEDGCASGCGALAAAAAELGELGAIAGVRVAQALDRLERCSARRCSARTARRGRGTSTRLRLPGGNGAALSTDVPWRTSPRWTGSGGACEHRWAARARGCSIALLRSSSASATPSASASARASTSRTSS